MVFQAAVDGARSVHGGGSVHAVVELREDATGLHHLTGHYQSAYIVTLSGEVRTFDFGTYILDFAARRNHVFGAIHDGPMLVFDGSEPPKRVLPNLRTATLSVAGDAVCVVSYGHPERLQCFNEETLHELWHIDLPNETGGFGDLVQDAENVYVLGQGRALAFNAASGTRLRATNEFRSFSPFKVIGTNILTLGDLGAPEWRDTSSGEVIGHWRKQESLVVHDVSFVGGNVLVEFYGFSHPSGGDDLCLIKLPDSVTHRQSLR